LQRQNSNNLVYTNRNLQFDKHPTFQNQFYLQNTNKNFAPGQNRKILEQTTYFLTKPEVGGGPAM